MKVIFVGAGAIAKSHLDAFRLAGAEVAGICTRSLSGQSFCSENQIPFFSQDLSSLLQQAKPNAVVCLTQPSSYPQVLEIVQNQQLPVFLEKPIAYNSQQAKNLQKLLPKLCFVGLNRRFYSGVRELREEIHSSKDLFVQLYLPERQKDFAHCDELTRKNWHILNGVHGLDLLTHLAGFPTEVLLQESWGSLSYTDLPRVHTAFFRTSRGHRVSFMNHFDAAGGWRLHFFFPQKEVIFSPFEETRIRTLKGIEVLAAGESDKLAKPGFLLQAKSFLDGVKQGAATDDWVSFESALESILAIEKIFGNVKQV